ncbi:MAG: hypothetical protein AAF961_02170 [Planctomycetota bacterium]
MRQTDRERSEGPEQPRPAEAELDRRRQALLATLPLRSWRSVLPLGIACGALFGYGVFRLSHLPLKPSDAELWLPISCGLLGGLPLMLLLIVQLDRGPKNRALRGMLQGDHLAHWTYNAQEWRRYVEQQRRKRDGLVPTTSTMLVQGCFVGGLVAAVSAFLFGNSDSASTAPIGLGFAAGVALYLAITLASWSRQAVWCRALARRRGEAFITRECVYFHSRLYGWSGFGGGLQSVTLQRPKKSIKILRFEVTGRHQRGQFTLELDVPIPDSESAVAKKIVEQLTQIT